MSLVVIECGHLKNPRQGERKMAVAGSSNGSPRAALMIFFLFAVIGYMGFQDLRFRWEAQAKNKELESIYKELQVARQGRDELERIVMDLREEKRHLELIKSNTSIQLLESENHKRLIGEEKTQLRETLSDREKQIQGLKQQLRVLRENEMEVAKLRESLRQLEDQLELLKETNTSAGAGAGSKQEKLVEKKQGEDPDHGLVPSDKAEEDQTSDLDQEPGSESQSFRDSEKLEEDQSSGDNNDRTSDDASSGDSGDTNHQSSGDSSEPGKEEDLDDRKRGAEGVDDERDVLNSQNEAGKTSD